jgi:hypothetical protein
MIISRLAVLLIACFCLVQGFVHVRKIQIQGLFKAMYQQIQGLNTEEKGLEISKI